ncbi:hypothetical protein CPB84DRAFT_1689130, partial [Gymnopilus junonius]
SSEATEWNAKNYVQELTSRCTGCNTKVEEHLRWKFPPIHTPSAYELQPCIVTDVAEHILAWYLPRVLTPQCLVSQAILRFRG